MKKFLFTLCCILTSALSYAYDFEVDGIYYNITSSIDKTVEVTQGNSVYKIGEITLPSTVTYKNVSFAVTQIGDHAFNGSTFDGITIPASVKKIGYRAFAYSSNYNRPYYLCFEGDITIDSEAFWCSWYGTFIFKNNSSPFLSDSSNRGYLFNSNPRMCINEGRDASLFYNFAARGNVTFFDREIEDSFLKRLALNQFLITSNDYEYEITSLCMPYTAMLYKVNSKDKILTLPSYADYADYHFLINTAGDNVFKYPDNLEEVIIPEGYTKLGRTFNGCSFLKKIEIASSVNDLSKTFAECTSLDYVISSIEAPFETDAFNKNIISLFSVLAVPAGTKALYEVASGWKDFSSIVEIAYYSFNVSTSVGGMVTVLGNTLSNTSMSATVKEGEDVTLSFTPDDGYGLKSVVVNGVDVIGSVENGCYTISAVSQNTTVEVTYAELPVYLTIKSADNGSIAQEIEKGKAYSFVITPNEGWDIESVSFNGENVTSQLEDNRYTTPSITSDSELNIVYKQDVSSAVKSLKSESNVKVSAAYGRLTIDNAGTNVNLSVFTTSGVEVASEIAGVGTTTIDLPTNNIYVVK